MRDSSGNPFLLGELVWEKIATDSPTRAVAIGVGEGHAQKLLIVDSFSLMGF